MPVGGGNFGEQKWKGFWSEGAGAGQWLLTGSRFKVEMQVRLGGQEGWEEKLLPLAAACSMLSIRTYTKVTTYEHINGYLIRIPYCVSSCASLGLRRAISEALRLAAPLPTSSSTSCSQPGDTASHGINLGINLDQSPTNRGYLTATLKQSSNAAMATVLGALRALPWSSKFELGDVAFHSIGPLPHDE
ncbi:hypothetical protein BDP55DRAFT_636955 [Colletotrichum godetiae]|uniref:Uncharacterized protein n=1 Tax=Colletotrichum godetiae TaxID=1209918 RepID=A0AAJ0AAD2_9PEZI|nr:uncharacterized protein BDP55DRAFT_636955 [Colletotrichum godetiae]KAK1659488.1 hypothetical protein BDP55DRAFT_636955 [Colletotrichum godetiae]